MCPLHALVLMPVARPDAKHVAGMHDSRPVRISEATVHPAKPHVARRTNAGQQPECGCNRLHASAKLRARVIAVKTQIDSRSAVLIEHHHIQLDVIGLPQIVRVADSRRSTNSNSLPYPFGPCWANDTKPRSKPSIICCTRARVNAAPRLVSATRTVPPQHLVHSAGGWAARGCDGQME